jgi:flavin-dependent dehydrogenase
MSEQWDVIVVGARCAGAALAATLARRGVRTLLLEASPRGTDMSMSTHYVQPAGMAALDRLGIGDRVRAVTPPTKSLRAAVDDVEIIAPLRPAHLGYCVRRSTLDPWLQDTAEAAGAHFRDRHRVVDLIKTGDRVTGVVVERPAGKETLSATLVVGADGPHSTVARLAGAEEYLGVDGTRGGYFMYFPAPTTWPFPWDATLEHRGNDLRYVFRTDGDLVILVAATTRKEASSWGKDWRKKTLAMLRASPTTRELSEGREPLGKGVGLIQMRFFYRRPIGPGFALAGDAGHFKDFVTGQGMTDALLDAERLARAIIDGREAAFQRYWYERDVETMPLHFDAVRQGKVGYNTAFTRWIFSQLKARPDLVAKFALLNERTVSPYDLIPVSSILSWIGAALLRGRFDVLGGFFTAGKALGEEQKEIALRKKRLDELVEELSVIPRAAA